MTKLFLCFLSIVFLGACISTGNPARFYSSNKVNLIKITEKSKVLISNYKFEEASIRTHNNKQYIRLSVSIKKPYKGTGEYYDYKTLEPIDPFNSDVICDSCSENENSLYAELLKDSTLKEIIRLYKQFNIRAINIDQYGVFFALKSKDFYSMVETGIFIAFEDSFKNENKELISIDDRVFKFEMVVH